MATTWKAPTWRMPNDKNQSKFESYSLDFNSANSEFIDCGNSSDLDITGALTISFWIYGATNSMHNGIISKAPSTSNITGLGQYHIQYQASNQLRFVVTGVNLKAGDETTGTVPTIDVGSWQHIVMTWNGTNEMIVYKNGIQVATKIQSSTISSNTSSVLLGRRNGYGDLEGQLSQVCIFDYALSEPQISSLYNSGSPINPMTLKPAPIAYYPLGGNASTGGDSSNTLSVPNVAVPDASVFDFDGSSDYINLGTNLQDVLNSNQNTISIWFRSDTTSNFDTLFSQGKNNSIGYRLYVRGGGTVLSLNRSEQSPNNNGQTVDISFEHQKWNHLVLVTNTSNSTKLIAYLNGSSVGTYLTGTITYSNNGTEAWIGGQSGISQFWDGQVSNVQVWNTELSASEVTTLYNSGVPLLTGTQPQASNLKAWYKLDQLDSYWDIAGIGNWTISNEAIN